MRRGRCALWPSHMYSHSLVLAWYDNYPKAKQFHLVIAAFAAINALGTPSQVLSPSGTTVMFSNISTVIGVMPANDAVFVCPSTAFYFVHYKLRAQRPEQVTTVSCIISLLAGSDEIQVSSFKSCFCRRYLKNDLCYGTI